MHGLQSPAEACTVGVSEQEAFTSLLWCGLSNQTYICDQCGSICDCRFLVLNIVPNMGLVGRQSNYRILPFILVKNLDLEFDIEPVLGKIGSQKFQILYLSGDR